MFSPIEVSIRPSRQLQWLNGISHVCLLGLMLFSLAPSYLKPLLALGAVASAVLAQRAIGSAALLLRWDVDRRTLSVRRGSEPWQPVEQLESTMVLPWCVLMRLRLAHGCIRLVIVPDSVSTAEYRRLAVLARLAPLTLNVSDPATRN